MNLCLNLALSWVGKRVFVPPTAPTAISFQSLTANGTSGTVSTTQLTATFDVDPGLTTANFVVTGASKGVVSKVGAVYTVNINTITVDDGQSVTLDIIGVPSGFTITPTTRTVVVNKAAALEAPTVIATLDFPQATIGVPFSFSIAYVFAGEIDTFETATGTLPSWATLNASTGLITGTPDAESTAAGLSFTATNAAGSSPESNTDDLVTIPDATGDGTLTTAPSPFYGHSRIDATGIITSIGFIEDPNGQEAPVSIAAFANTTLAGSRRLTTKPLNGYEHAHHVWELTKANGDPIDEDFDGIKNYRYNPSTQLVEGTDVNVHIGTISPEFTDLMLNHGDYKLTLKAYGMTSDNVNALMATDEYTFSIAKPTNNHIYIDPVNGDDANDGLDPLGLSLTNASYVEATGILTETGKFTGLVLDSELYDTDTKNFVHITGFGRARIAEVIDGNSARIDDRWKLGSDQTGLTSSNGPRQTIDTTPSSNTVYHIKAGDYEIASPIAFDTRTGHCGLYFYGGQGRLYSNTIAGGSYLIATGSPSGTAVSPDKLMLSNFEVDSQGIQSNPIRAGTGNSDTTLKFRAIYRHLTQKGSSGSGIFSPGTPTNGLGAAMDVLVWGNYLNNLKVASEAKAVAMFTYHNERSSFRCIGNITDNDADNPTLDHHWYPNGLNDHYHAAWNWFREGAGSNYCINTNVAKDLGTWTRRGVSYHDMFFGGAIRGIDFSNHDNIDDMFFENIYVARCQSNLDQDFYYPSTAISSFMVACDHYATATEGQSAFFRTNAGTLPAYNHVMERCRNYGPMLYNAGAQTPTVEFFDCESVNTRTDTIFQIRAFQPSLSESTFTDNVFYSPNSGDGNVYQIDGSTTNLAALNALTNSTGNTEAVISWSDWPSILAGALNEIAFSSAVANGSTGSVTSTEVVLTFDEDPTGLADTDITVTDATKGALSGTGTTRTLAISDITVANGETINIAIANNNGNTFVPNNLEATVYVGAVGRLYLDPPSDTAATLSFDVGADLNRIYDGQGLRFKVITSDIVTANGGGLAVDSSNFFRLKPGGNGAINLRAAAAYSQTAEFVVDFPAQSVIWDGSEHLIDMPLVANAAVTVSVDGTPYAHPTITFSVMPQIDINYIRGSGTYYIYDIEVYDIATSTVMLKFDVDSGTLVGTEPASIGTGTLTLNVSEGDWTDTPA